MKLTRRGQSALEYLLLLALVAAVVMISFRSKEQKGLLGRTQSSTNQYFSTVSRAIIGGEGNHPTPVDGGWCGLDGQPLGDRSSSETCPSDLPCGTSALYRRCECPAPAFGGKHCMENDAIKNLASVSCQAAPCKECTDLDDSCDAPEPVNCQISSSGLTRCSKKPCTIKRPCSECLGQIPEDTVGDCPATRADVPEGTKWQAIDRAIDCAQQKCTRYRRIN